MTKRREVIKFFKDHGFWSLGGTKHEKLTNGTNTILIKRHSEIEDVVFESLNEIVSA